LGQTLYTAITGRVPFPYKTTVDIFLKKNSNDFPSPSQYVDNLRDGTVRTICNAMDANPAHRPQTIKAFIRQLLAEGTGTRKIATGSANDDNHSGDLDTVEKTDSGTPKLPEARTAIRAPVTVGTASPIPGKSQPAARRIDGGAPATVDSRETTTPRKPNESTRESVRTDSRAYIDRSFDSRTAAGRSTESRSQMPTPSSTSLKSSSTGSKVESEFEIAIGAARSKKWQAENAVADEFARTPLLFLDAQSRFLFLALFVLLFFAVLISVLTGLVR
jgi:hypothetical protein